MKSSYDVLVKQIITEKTAKLAEEMKYTFEVAQGANKVEVKKAVEEIFNRKVESVKIVNVRKKAKKMGRYEGFTAAVRKAIVTLEKGQKPLDVFEI